MVTVSILVLFTLGFVAAALLGISSKILAVEEDPRVEAVVEVLPGANCGGCGFAGCENYAQAVVSDPDVPAGLCVAGGEETSIKVGNLTGKIVAAMEPQISFRRCEKIEGKVAVRFEYQGMPSCAAAALLGSGQGTDQCAIFLPRPRRLHQGMPLRRPVSAQRTRQGRSVALYRMQASAPGHAPATFWRSFPAVPA